MMNTITIDSALYREAESFARNSNVSIREFIEKAIMAAIPRPFTNTVPGESQQDVWRTYQVSPAVMTMTFEERKDIPEDYDSELQKGLVEKY